MPRPNIKRFRHLIGPTWAILGALLLELPSAHADQRGNVVVDGGRAEVADCAGLGADPDCRCASTEPRDWGTPTATQARVDNAVQCARTRIEAFFGLRFEQNVSVDVAESRRAFDAALPESWGMSATECWMVGVGTADRLLLLDPARWASEACEHDATERHVQEIVAHEMTHVFHGQHNTNGDFAGMDELEWLIEGLAVYVSGQLDTPRHSGYREATCDNHAPSTLLEIPQGGSRYGRSGAFVRYVDQRFGRQALQALLPAHSNNEALKILAQREDELVSAWVDQLCRR